MHQAANVIKEEKPVLWPGKRGDSAHYVPLPSCLQSTLGSSPLSTEGADDQSYRGQISLGLQRGVCK